MKTVRLVPDEYLFITTFWLSTWALAGGALAPPWNLKMSSYAVFKQNTLTIFARIIYT